MDAGEDLLGGVDAEEEEEKPNPVVFKEDLNQAAMNDDTAEVLKLCNEGVPPTFVQEKSGWTPLHWAAKNGNIEMVSALIDHGATAPYHRMVKRELLKKKREAKALEEAKKQQNAVAIEASAVEEAVNENPEGEADAEVAESKGDDEGKVKSGDAKEGNEAKEGDAAATTNLEETSVTPSQAAATPADEVDALDEEEDEDDLDYEAAMERKAETSTNLLQNTPLLWACTKGHLRIVWMLLLDGYSPNDTDSMGNNALHLAASCGSSKVIHVLVDDGAYSTKVNVYKNLPIDMATDKECRQILVDAMEKGASMTAQDIASKHEANMKKFTKLTNNLESAIKTANTSDGIRALQGHISACKEAGIAEELISQAETSIEQFEMGIELLADLEMVQKNMPICNQEQFSSTVYKLESTLFKAKTVGADAGQIAYAAELIQKCEMEFWVSSLTKRLEDVTCATDTNEHDMDRLKAAISKGQDLKVDDSILGTASTLCNRLYAELGMSRALATVPAVVKLPLKEGAEYPDNYWGEDDIGHVVETPEYPHPPADTGEYVWEPSKSMSAVVAAIANIKASYVGAEDLGANPDVCAEAKAKLAKAEKDLKALKVKDEADKLAAIEATAKLCKKKGKGKK